MKQTKLDDMAGEFPRFDERRAGLSYRHGYFAADTLGTGKVIFNGIAHIDFKTGQRIVHELPMPNVGDELHHYGWNRCSSALPASRSW